MMEKFNAVSTPLDGTNLIEASAGTGKTFTISMIYLRLLVEQGFRVEEILVVTFTLPATMELRLRIRGVINDALRFCETGSAKERCVEEIMNGRKDDPVITQRLRGALKSFDEASVYTIHSFCQQVLADNAFESGSLFSCDIVTDDVMHERLAADFWRRNVYGLPEHLAAYIMREESPDSLLNLYGKLPLSPQRRIEPVVKAPSIAELEKLVSSVERMYKKLSAEWGKGRKLAEVFLCEDSSLNRNKYRKESMQKRIADLEQYLGSGDFLSPPEGLDYFTLEKISESLRKGCEAPDFPLFMAAGSLAESIEIYASSCRAFLVGMRLDMFSFMEKEGARLKGEIGKRGFDDLIKDLQRALGTASGGVLAERVRGRYRAALIDEFQDTDDLQFEIFSGIFGTGKSILFLIGDPKQAIYRFRGADIFSYLKASKSVKNRYTLANNFRSTPGLIKSVNELFSRGDRPFVFEGIDFTAVEPGKADQGEHILKGKKILPAMDIGLADYSAVQSGDDDNDSIILRQLSAEISEMTGSGEYKFIPSGKPVKPSDVAVLVRSHSHAAAVQGALAAAGIPSVTRGHESVLATEEAAEVCRIISAIAEPGRSGRVRSAAATSIFGYDASMLYKLSGDSADGTAMLENITERFHGYRDVWLRSGFMDMFTLLLEQEDITVNILGRRRGERIMANISHISEVLNMAQFENSFSPDELAVWMENALAEPPSGDQYAIRLDKDSDAVNIVTMHACKGLEYPVVYCPYLTHSWQPPGETVIYHDPVKDNAPVICLDKESVTDEIKERKMFEDLAENVRLMYVALTRAKSQCRVLFMVKSDFKKSAPAHVLLEGALPDKGKTGEYFNIFADALKKIAAGSDGNIAFGIVSGEKPGTYGISGKTGVDLEQRIFSGEISRHWGMQSYSSIAKSGVNEKSDGHTGRSSEEGTGIFAFPRGTKAGLCLHEIFELCDFGERDRTAVSGTVSSLLRKYSFDEAWESHVTDMFFNTTGSILDRETGLTLSQITVKDRLSEMEFNFPLSGFSVSGLRDIFRSAPSYGKDVYNRLGEDDTGLHGMMKGFIDLVFRSGDKYYIADWKSNSLGIRSEDYSIPGMEEEMLLHNYHLQYYLYSVALHRYLSFRLGAGYSYSRNFGGVFYLFVRGMTGDDSGSGIFHALPDEKTVTALDQFFRNGVNR